MKRVLYTAAALLLATAFALLAGCTRNEETEPELTAAAPTQAAERGEESAKQQSGGNKQTETDDGNKAKKLEPATYTVRSEDCFKEGGFVSFLALKTTKLTVTVDSAYAEVGFEIYVLDDKFGDALRYIPQTYEPLLAESGELNVTAGQYVYIYCTVNSFTAAEPVEGATVTFTGVGLPE